ncbi:hypothetical protein KIH39_15235 [Telmatocola sphagniphila]|uniref:Uncharacterized protein n=1 Tax=Telmatocola sphagniphila TaxID=1123043 RepID=A0A8E6EWJ5_9BACT|nr:hypothetical protein [Telmatocola sphagniphila]QVL30206.1 hypothetical protein KIH39_15235 [Telmatocola sphagniphila]
MAAKLIKFCAGNQFGKLLPEAIKREIEPSIARGHSIGCGCGQVDLQRQQNIPAFYTHRDHAEKRNQEGIIQGQSGIEFFVLGSWEENLPAYSRIGCYGYLDSLRSLGKSNLS